jgi:hypothetical protein
MGPRLAIVGLVVLAGCASTPSQVSYSPPAPNPNGCYVFVFERPEWQGARVMLNGPDKRWNLERLLLNEEDWRNRIRSVDVGPAAMLTVYTDLQFKGASRRFGPGSRAGRLDGDINARIESLELQCTAIKK